MNQQLYQQLQKAGDVLLTVICYNAKLKDLNDQMNANRAKVVQAEKSIKEQRPNWYYTRILGGILFLFLSAVFVFAFGITFITEFDLFMSDLATDPMSIILAIIIFLLACILLPLSLLAIISAFVSKKKLIKRAKKEYEELKVTTAERNLELSNEYNTRKQDREQYASENWHHLDFLPKPYQNAHAVAFMLDAVHNLRADTLKEAINLYEQELKHIEAMEAAEIQKQQNIDLLNVLEQTQTSIDKSTAALEEIRNMEYIKWLHDRHD